MADLCTDCLKKMAVEVTEKHPPVSYHSDYYEFPEGCCENPTECADFKAGECAGGTEKT